jgi:hypothetical protein
MRDKVNISIWLPNSFSVTLFLAVASDQVNFYDEHWTTLGVVFLGLIWVGVAAASIGSEASPLDQFCKQSTSSKTAQI